MRPPARSRCLDLSARNGRPASGNGRLAGGNGRSAGGNGGGGGDEARQAAAAPVFRTLGSGAVAAAEHRVEQAGGRGLVWLERDPMDEDVVRVKPQLLVLLYRNRATCLRAGYKRGSTGSDSSASTPNTASCIRHSGSPRAPRSRASSPSAYSRSASERLRPRLRSRSRARLAGSV